MNIDKAIELTNAEVISQLCNIQLKGSFSTSDLKEEFAKGQTFYKGINTLTYFHSEIKKKLEDNVTTIKVKREVATSNPSEPLDRAFWKSEDFTIEYN